MFGWKIYTSIVLTIMATYLIGFIKEAVDQLINNVFCYHCSDGYWVILKNIDQAFLEEGLIDGIRLLEEEFYPS